MIPGAKPYFPASDRGQILEEIDKILQSGALTQGPHQNEFEAIGAEMAGTKFAVAVNSGGTALELVMESLALDGGEVIVPTQTFVASPNSVVRAGGQPVFADIDRNTLNLSAETVAPLITAKTKAVMVVHMFGLISPDTDELRELCRVHNLPLIEDAAHAHGAEYKNSRAGGLGLAGCFSYYATKILTSGEGGLITTDDENLAKELISRRNHGRDDLHSTFGRAGNNFRMSEIAALLAVTQHRRLNEMLEHRRAIAEIYRNALSEFSPVVLIDPEENSGHAYWRYSLLLPSGLDRADIQLAMEKDHGVRITWMYEPLCHQQPYYLERNYNLSLPIAESMIGRLINLPTHPGVTPEDAKKASEGLRKAVSERLK
jgi:perosamine synthetase